MAKKGSRRKQRATAIKGQPDLKKGLLWAAVAFASAGVALALYSTRLSMKIATQGIVEASGCSINDLVNCDLALASSYADLLGVPVAWWGLLFYAFAGLGALFGAAGSNRRSAAGWISFAWILSIGAVAFSVLKAFHLYQLGVLCIVCLGMYGVNLALLFLLPLGLGVGPGQWGGFLGDWVKGVRGEPSELKFEPKLTQWGLVALVIFGLGFIGMKREE